MSAATSLVSQGQDLLARDSGLLWHPYASLDDGARYAVTAAQGVRLTLEDAHGTHEAIDGMGSWWSMVHGYRNPVLDAAAHAQIDSFSHVMFGGLTHAPAVELAERLVAMAPGNLGHVFLADSGSISVEVALKLVLQYQHARGHTGRQRFAALRGGYHGDTFAAMGVCDPVDGMHAAFARPGAEQLFLPRPPAPGRPADRGRQLGIRCCRIRRLGNRGPGAGRRPRPGTGRDHCRARPAGRRGHARLCPGGPARAARNRGRTRAAAGAR